MNLLFLSFCICGVISMPFSLQPVPKLSLLERYISNPSQFISAMSEVDPVEIAKIVALLNGLKAVSESREQTLINDLSAAEAALSEASNDVIDAEGVVSAADTARYLADASLTTKQANRTSKLAAFNEAQRIHDDEINDLNDEQAVLNDVIIMLKELIGSQNSDSDDNSDDGWSEFSQDEACENNGQGRAHECDISNGGGIECCKTKALENGWTYVVWWANQCYATDTCVSPYQLVDTVNYHYNDPNHDFIARPNKAFLSVASSPSAGVLNHTMPGRKLFGLAEDGLAILKENPKQFIAEMSKVDPAAVQQIVDMLEDLKTKSETREEEIINNLNNARDELGTASQAVVAAEGVLRDAETTKANADQDLVNKQTIQSNAESARDLAQNVHDAEIGDLNGEQDVLSQVIAALEDLVARQA